MLHSLGRDPLPLAHWRRRLVPRAASWRLRRGGDRRRRASDSARFHGAPRCCSSTSCRSSVATCSRACANRSRRRGPYRARPGAAFPARFQLIAAMNPVLRPCPDPPSLPLLRRSWSAATSANFPVRCSIALTCKLRYRARIPGAAPDAASERGQRRGGYARQWRPAHSSSNAAGSTAPRSPPSRPPADRRAGTWTAGYRCPPFRSLGARLPSHPACRATIADLRVRSAWTSRSCPRPSATGGWSASRWRLHTARLPRSCGDAGADDSELRRRAHATFGA